MSETKFTPGPWVFENKTPEELPHIMAGEWPVCTAEYHSYSDFSGVQINNEADANLIAAAPDLYAALEKALPVLVQHLEEPWRGVMPFEPEASKMRADLEQVAAVRAALAKARGGAQ